jgi:hypothetical protein
MTLEDMFSKGRAYERRGVLNGRAKFTLAEVDRVRTDPRPQHVIAAEFAVSQSTICRIKNCQVYAR